MVVGLLHADGLPGEDLAEIDLAALEADAPAAAIFGSLDQVTKRSRIDLWVHMEVDSIACFVREALPFFETRSREAGAPGAALFTADGRQTNASSLVDCQRIVLESAVQRLNALVDGILLALHWRSGDEPDPVGMLQSQNLSRAALTQKLEAHYGVTLRFIRGWDIVEQVRNDANALKHRSGITLVPWPQLGTNEFVQIQLTRDQVERSLEGIRGWLQSVIGATEGTWGL